MIKIKEMWYSYIPHIKRFSYRRCSTIKNGALQRTKTARFASTVSHDIVITATRHNAYKHARVKRIARRRSRQPFLRTSLEASSEQESASTLKLTATYWVAKPCTALSQHVSTRCLPYAFRHKQPSTDNFQTSLAMVGTENILHAQGAAQQREPEIQADDNEIVR